MNQKPSVHIQIVKYHLTDMYRSMGSLYEGGDTVYDLRGCALVNEELETRIKKYLREG